MLSVLVCVFGPQTPVTSSDVPILYHALALEEAESDALSLPKAICGSPKELDAKETVTKRTAE